MTLQIESPRQRYFSNLSACLQPMLRLAQFDLPYRVFSPEISAKTLDARLISTASEARAA
jgi:hypothetical protein